MAEIMDHFLSFEQRYLNHNPSWGIATDQGGFPHSALLVKPRSIKRGLWIWGAHALVFVLFISSMSIYGYALILKQQYIKPHTKLTVPFDPPVAAKKQAIVSSSNAKNLTLANFNYCADYELEMSMAGYPVENLLSVKATKSNYPGYPARVVGHPGIMATAHLGCAWFFMKNKKPHSYITIQLIRFSQPLIESELEYIKGEIYDPDNPPAAGVDVFYASVPYEIKGYLAHIMDGIDSNWGRICSLNIVPYVFIAATGPDCNRVLRFAYNILP